MRCKGTTADGNRCQRNAQEGSDYCYQHKENYKHNVSGRPAKYDKQFIEELADKMVEWYEDSEDNVFLDKFMVEQGLYSELVSRFAEKNNYFHQSLKRVKDIQKVRLLEKGLYGIWDKSLVIFTLKNVSGMRDRQEHKVEQEGNITINVEGV